MVAQDAEPEGSNEDAILVANERKKLTATYLNAGATGFFTTGVVAPIAAAIFGLAGPNGQIPTLTLGIGDTRYRRADLSSRKSGAAHCRALRAQWSEVVTDIQILAFIVVPIVAVAFGWGVALWARYQD